VGAASQPVRLAILSVVLAVCWQWTVIHAAYNSNWTALFCIGDRYQRPPEMAGGEYVFHGISGYDGQFYQVIAHDPLMTWHYDRFIDSPRVRYRRILIPGLAYLVAGGRQAAVDWTYIIVCWWFIGLGTFALARLAEDDERSPWWGLLFFVTPSTLAAIERMTVDVSPCALIPAALLALRRQAWRTLWFVLAAAALSKEMGILVTLAVVVWVAREKRYRLAATLSSSILPAVAWWLFVESRTVGEYPTADFHFLTAFLQSLAAPLSPGIVSLIFRIATIAAAAALFWAAVWSIVLAVRDRFQDVALLMAALFGALLLVFQMSDIWEEPNGFTRIYSVLLVSLVAATLRRKFAQTIVLFVVASLPLLLQFGVHFLGPVWRLAAG
jgi:hypothetical protein